MPASSRLPRLGARGQGWFALQAALMALVGLTALTEVYWPDSVAGLLAVVGFVLIAAALVLMALAGVSLLFARALTALPRPREGATLAQSGIYRIVRHPVYGGLVLIALGWSLAESPLGLIPAALLAVVFDLKARVEESWLEERYPDYAGYREQTPWRFLPGLY